VGRYGDATGVHGFSDVIGNFTSINVPGAFFTTAYGINDFGNIVGGYGDATRDHGFIASPVPEPTTMLFLISTVIGLIVFSRKFKH